MKVFLEESHIQIQADQTNFSLNFSPFSSSRVEVAVLPDLLLVDFC